MSSDAIPTTETSAKDLPSQPPTSAAAGQGVPMPLVLTLGAVAVAALVGCGTFTS